MNLSPRPLTAIRGPRGRDLPVFVAHVRYGFEERRRSIERQMMELRLPFEFFLEGDVGDLSEALLDRWFSGWMKGAHPNASCAAKHLLLLERMLRESIPEVLVLEDDAILTSNFRAVVERCVRELESNYALDEPWYVSIENSTLHFVPRSERTPNQVLYRANRGRCAGGYLLNRELATLILESAEGGQVDAQIDTFMDRILGRDLVQTFWCEPPVVEQGSHSGRFQSSLGKSRTDTFSRLHYRLRRAVRELKYRMH